MRASEYSVGKGPKIVLTPRRRRKGGDRGMASMIIIIIIKNEKKKKKNWRSWEGWVGLGTSLARAAKCPLTHAKLEARTRKGKDEIGSDLSRSCPRKSGSLFLASNLTPPPPRESTFR